MKIAHRLNAYRAAKILDWEDEAKKIVIFYEELEKTNNRISESN